MLGAIFNSFVGNKKAEDVHNGRETRGAKRRQRRRGPRVRHNGHAQDTRMGRQR